MEPVIPLQLLTMAAMVLWLANAVWAFRDARRRGRSGVLIGALVAFTFPLGAALWFFARPNEAIAPGSDDAPDAELKRRANEEVGFKAGDDPDAELKRRANAGTL